jgi:hypothetical protein
MTAQALATWALRKVGAVAAVDTPSAEDMRDALADLNLMLKSWQVAGPNLFRQTFRSVTLIAATGSYVLSPRPMKVIEARYRDSGGRDLPMKLLTRQEYVDLPQKSASGTPTQYYVDHQRDSVTLYVWPVRASVTTETIEMTVQRVVEDIDSQDNDIDIPQEWFECVGYNLSFRLLERFPNNEAAPLIRAQALSLLAQARDHDREDVVRFEPEWH